MRTSLFCLLFLLVYWTGCKSDDDTIDNNLINEIPEEQFEDFTVEPFLTEGYVDLSWNVATLDSTFIKYILIRSRDSLTLKNPSSLINDGFHVNLNRVYDINETTFRDSELLLVGDYFYQLFVQFEDYFLRSKPVRVINPIEGYNLRLVGCEYLPESDYLYLSSNRPRGVIKYNLESRRVEAGSGPYPLNQYITISDSGTGHELMVRTGFPGLYSSLDLDNLSIIEQFQLGYEPYNITFNKSGFLVASILDHLSVESNLLVYQKANNEITDILNNLTGGTSIIEMIDEENSLFYEASSSHLYLRDVSNEGKINTLKETEISIPTNVNPLKRSIAISPDGNLFIPYKKTIIFNQDLETVEDLEFESDAHLFSSDGNFLFVGSLGEVLTYETNNYSLINNPIKLPFDDFQVRYLFEINNELVIISTHYSSALGPDVLISRSAL